MDKFFYACGLLNVCGTNNGSYIPISQKPNKQAIIVHAYNYYRHKNYNSIVLQAICDMDKLFWNVCCLILGEMMDADQFQVSFIYQ